MPRLNDRWILRSCLWLFIVALPLGVGAQQITLRTRSNLVLVPTLVESKTGDPVFNLGVQDFIVKDNGVEQKIHLDEDMDKTPMSIVLLVQVGGSAVREFHKMIGLPTMLTALAGNTMHRVAIVEFDSQPRTLLDFSASPDAVEQAVYSIQPGDGSAVPVIETYCLDQLRYRLSLPPTTVGMWRSSQFLCTSLSGPSGDVRIRWPSNQGVQGEWGSRLECQSLPRKPRFQFQSIVPTFG